MSNQIKVRTHRPSRLPHPLPTSVKKHRRRGPHAFKYDPEKYGPAPNTHCFTHYTRFECGHATRQILRSSECVHCDPRGIPCKTERVWNRPRTTCADCTCEELAMLAKELGYSDQEDGE